MAIDAKVILAQNVRSLMLHHWGEVNISRLGRHIQQGNAQRILAGKTSIGLDVLAKCAAVFELQPWQLLIPNLRPDNPPVAMVSEAELRLYAAFQQINAATKNSH